MILTTLGDLFPELAECRRVTAPRNPVSKKKSHPGTARKLKNLYPEIEAWDPFYVTSAWLYWGKTCGIELGEPDVRDERFPAFLVSFIHTKMLEQAAELKLSSRKGDKIDAAIMRLGQSGQKDADLTGGVR